MDALLGFRRSDDSFPSIWLQPLKGEKVMMNYSRRKRLNMTDLEEMLDEYYDERGWDIQSGMPSPGRCKELGLG